MLGSGPDSKANQVTEGKTPNSFESSIVKLETSFLSSLATPSYPAKRVIEEANCAVRTPFQRDRDRIVHSKAFRRLKYKTQVFIAPQGDHYRTRLTHTLEATQVSRTVARALRLNEDLTEAIALGHDLGHAPFGHIGEEILDQCLRGKGFGGFRHNEHSLRVVERIERDGQGLNLTDAVRDGILCHTSDAKMPATLEGKIVRIVDRIAYINHDIDDALRAGVIGESDLPQEELKVLGDSGRKRIDTLVHDLVETSSKAGDIKQGDEIGSAMLRLRKFMFQNVYLGQAAQHEYQKIQKVIGTLFDHYLTNIEQVPLLVPKASAAERVTDYIAGMTDRFCISTFEDLTVPQGFML